MRKVRLAVVLLGTALVVTGCGQGPQRLAGNAVPAGATSTVEPTSDPVGEPTSEPGGQPTSEPVGEPTSQSGGQPTSDPANRPTTLGPDGFGALKLGMSRSQAEATGLISGYKAEDFGAKCGYSKLKGTSATVYFTPGLGVSSIDASAGVRTPEGIRLGSTMNAVRKAYPDWELAVGDGDTGGAGPGTTAST